MFIAIKSRNNAALFSRLSVLIDCETNTFKSTVLYRDVRKMHFCNKNVVSALLTVRTHDRSIEIHFSSSVRCALHTNICNISQRSDKPKIIIRPYAYRTYPYPKWTFVYATANRNGLKIVRKFYVRKQQEVRGQSKTLQQLCTRVLDEYI